MLSRLLAVLFILGISFPIFGEIKGDRIIQEISVIGNHVLSASELKMLMVTRKSPWYDWLPWVSSLKFDPVVLKADLVRLTAWYKDLGYYEVVIDTMVDRSYVDKVYLGLRIKEGKVVRVSRVSLEGMSGISELDSLDVLNGLQIIQGSPLVRAKIKEDQSLIVRKFQNRGFAFAEVSVKVGVRPELYSSEIIYRISAGPRCKFGNIQIKGNQKVSNEVVKRGLTFRKGEIYRKLELLKSQRQLYRSGAFSSVALGFPDSLVKTSLIELVVSVHERTPRNLKIGAEYNTEEDFKGALEGIHRNFLGGARRMSIRTSFSRLNASVEADLRQPYVWGSRTWMNLGTFIKREKVTEKRKEIFKKEEVGGAISLERNIQTRTNLIFQLITGLVDFEPDSAFTELRMTFLEDTRDDFFDPTDGVLLNVTARERGLLFRSDREFLQLTAEGRWYRPLPFQSVLAVRTLAGFIQKLGDGVDIPNVERFFGGGMNSVRGWGLNQMGPRDSSGEVSGGQSRFEGSIELRTRLFSFLGTALFIDVGRVGLNYDAFFLNDLQWAAGGGVRYLSPIGPIRLDLAYRISDDLFVDSKQLHLSLGQAF